MIAKGGSPLPGKPSVIPGSDCAAKIVLIGSATSKFKPGDRVSPNFALDHIYGPPTEATKATGLSGEIDGVLGEYRVFPEHVSRDISFIHKRVGSTEGRILRKKRDNA